MIWCRFGQIVNLYITGSGKSRLIQHMSWFLGLKGELGELMSSLLAQIFLFKVFIYLFILGEGGSFARGQI